MAMIEGVDKVVKVEGFNFNVLKEVVKKLNAAEVLDKPIATVGIKKEVLVNAFLKGIESIPEGSELEKKIPEEAAKLYNDYVDVMEDKKIALEYGVEKKEESVGEKVEGALKKKEFITRMMALGLAFKELNQKGFSKDQIVKCSDDIYVNNGGKSNLKEGNWHFGYFKKTFEVMKEVGLGDIQNIEFNLKK